MRFGHEVKSSLLAELDFCTIPRGILGPVHGARLFANVVMKR
jgi:hypothetical protein